MTHGTNVMIYKWIDMLHLLHTYSAYLEHMSENTLQRDTFMISFSVPQQRGLCKDTGFRLMFHEDHGEFILMGLLTLNSIGMIFS